MADDNTVFATPDFVVRYVKAGDLRNCVVSFSSFTDDPRLDRPGFGESFFSERGIDAIHVINRTNVWYQYREFPDALAAIRAITGRYDKCFTYGSSMGGYAAIRFADAVGAPTAIAISPQYSASPKVVRFDKRWVSITKKVDFFLEPAFSGSGAVAPLVFYDPSDLDARHFELIAAAYPKTKGVRLRHAGHPAGAYLSEAGILKDAIRDIIEGVFDPSGFERRARALRRSSGQYLFTLARRLPPSRLRLKLALASAAVRQREDAAYLIYLSMLVEKQGDLRSAEQYLQRANNVLAGHPVPIRATCAFLLRRGRFSEAVSLGRELVEIDPLRRDYLRLLFAGLVGTRDFDEVSRLIRAQSQSQIDPYRALLFKFIKGGLDVLTALRIEKKLFSAVSPVALAWLKRHQHINTEFAAFDEWRHRNRRGRARSSP